MHKKIYEVAADCVEYRIDKAIAAASPKLDSPLEQMFLEALVMAHLLSSRGIPPINETDSTGTDPIYGIRTQYAVGRYRADFLLVSWDGKTVLVECDGHDFHERTKEQAARDRKKDRDIQSAGHVILRFTGSEIWADPMKCVSEAVKTLFDSPRKIKGTKDGSAFDLDSWLKHGDDYEAILEKNKQELEKWKKSASAKMSEEA